MTPTTPAADAAQALQGVTDLIERLTFGQPCDAVELEAAAALTALSAEREALAAQVAELTRERDEARETLVIATNLVVAERAKVARLKGALREIADTHNDQWQAGRIARAALTEGTPE